MSQIHTPDWRQENTVIEWVPSLLGLPTET